jgi:hypothetical protein
MSQMEIARATVANCISLETTQQFDVALHDAVVTSAPTMAELRAAVCLCVAALRNANVGPVQMILAIKACALDSAIRYRPPHDKYPASNLETLMDQIVKWSIGEYYKDDS